MGEERKTGDTRKNDRGGEDRELPYGVSEDAGAIADLDVRPGDAVGGHEKGKEPRDEASEMEEARRG